MVISFEFLHLRSLLPKFNLSKTIEDRLVNVRDRSFKVSSLILLVRNAISKAYRNASKQTTKN